MSPAPPLYTRTPYRWITAALGLGFIGCGVWLLLVERPLTVAVGVVGMALVLAGGDMVQAAWRGALAWVARIGPLP